MKARSQSTKPKVFGSMLVSSILITCRHLAFAKSTPFIRKFSWYDVMENRQLQTDEVNLLKDDIRYKSIRPETSPLYTTSVYTFESLTSLQNAAQNGAYLYRRNGHPNQVPVESLLCEIENGESAALTSSGMAAISQACFAHLKPGNHIIVTRHFYGGTHAFFEGILRPWGVDITYSNLNDLAEVKSALRPNTKMVYAETIANPLVQVTDVSALGAFCQEHELKLFVDNTFSPLIFQPISVGATLSIHSLTKFLNGHSDVLGGAVIGNAEDVELVRRFSVTFGGTMAPFDAWMTERGLATVRLRFQQQSENAKAISEALVGHNAVGQVYYPGLDAHPTHHIACQLFGDSFGPMLSFEIKGGMQAADQFVKSLRHIELAPSLGGVKTTLSHPTLTSHVALSEAERQAIGITDGLLRLSAGIESASMLLADIMQALESLA